LDKTGCSAEIWIKEHHQRIWLYHQEKSSEAEHSINLGHRIKFHDTSILAKESVRKERISKKERRREPHLGNMSRKECFSLRRPWKPLIQILKERKKWPTIIQDNGRAEGVLWGG
jgi:hypothetical protein